jgi:transposase
MLYLTHLTYILMNGNARPHTAQIVRQYLHEVRIVIMNWPARSADLNPIEHLWDNMGRSLKTLHQPLEYDRSK